MGCWLAGCKMVIAGLSLCGITKLAREGASRRMIAIATTATTMPVNTLLVAVLFFRDVTDGTETKLFATPHRGQADKNDLYL